MATATLKTVVYYPKQVIIQVGQTINSTVLKYPFAAGILISGVKTNAADLFAQKVIERREKIDWKRFFLFSVFGYGYLGCVQYYLYTNLITKIGAPVLGTIGQQYKAVVYTFIDQFIHHPFFYLPVFYLLRGIAQDKKISQTFKEYWNELFDTCKALWSVWIPAQLVNFQFVPMHFRVPFVAMVSFIWTVILSQMRGRCEEAVEEQPQKLDPQQQIQQNKDKMKQDTEQNGLAKSRSIFEKSKLGPTIPTPLGEKLSIEALKNGKQIEGESDVMAKDIEHQLKQPNCGYKMKKYLELFQLEKYPTVEDKTQK